MAELPGSKTPSKIGDEAVKKATGKAWTEWFDILDKADALNMSHKEIASFLDKHHSVGPWWRQMVTVQYELSKGLREKYLKPEGYQISKSKTINASAELLFNAWKKSSVRKKWLKDPDITITSLHENKSIRGKWIDERISLEINFYLKGPDKTRVVVQNNKLKSAAEAEKMKSYWEQSLHKLADLTGKK